MLHPGLSYITSLRCLYDDQGWTLIITMLMKRLIHLLILYRNRADDHFKIRYLQIPPFVNLWDRYWLQCVLYYYCNTTLFSISPHEYPHCFFFVLISLIYLFSLPFFILFYPASNLLFIPQKILCSFLFFENHTLKAIPFLYSVSFPSNSQQIIYS